MSTLTSADRLAPTPQRLRPGSVLLVLTDDGADARYGRARGAAAVLAARAGASIVLYHVASGPASVDPGRARCFDPLAPGPAAAGPVEGRLHTGSRRRDLLLDEARAIDALGVPVRVWLSRLAGPAGVAEAVRATGASLVLAPAEPLRVGALCTAVRLTLSYYASRLDVPLAAVDPDGSISVVPALGMVGGARRRPDGLDPRPPRRVAAETAGRRVDVSPRRSPPIAAASSIGTTLADPVGALR